MFRLVERVTIEAPRELHRLDREVIVGVDYFGNDVEIDRYPPDVGGSVTLTKDVWKCTECRALAAGPPDEYPGTCGKCHK